MPFAATFLQERALFYWQQHKAKNTGEIDVPFTWKKFKAFFRQSLGESQGFIDSLWRIISRDFQYQQKKVMDWAAHLEHLQIMLREFDSAATLNEEVLICYFYDGLKPSIQAEINKRGWDLDTWKEAIKKPLMLRLKQLVSLSH